MKISVTVDQLDNNIARLVDFETGEYSFNMPVALLPKDIRENDVLEFDITKNDSQKQKQEEVVENLLQELLQGRHLR